MRVYEYHGTDDFHDQAYHEVLYSELWQGFVNDTSTAGIPRYAAAKGWCKRFTWMLLTLTVTGILGYHFYTIVERYRLRPVSIQQEILQNYNMEFPAVTFCNMNPVKKTAVGGNKELSKIVAKENQSKSKEARKRKRRDIWMSAQMHANQVNLAEAENLTDPLTISAKSRSKRESTSQEYCWVEYPAKDCGGSDFAVYPAATLAECLSMCDINTTCGAIVYVPSWYPNNNCHFKPNGFCQPQPHGLSGIVTAIKEDCIETTTEEVTTESLEETTEEVTTESLAETTEEVTTESLAETTEEVTTESLAETTEEVITESLAETTEEVTTASLAETTEEVTVTEVTETQTSTATTTTITTTQPTTTTSEPVCPSIAPLCPCVCEDAVKPTPPEPIILVAPPPPAPTPAPAAPAGEEVEPVRKPTTADYKEQAVVTETLSAMPEESKKSLGYSSWEFIVDCVVEGVPCDPQLDFEQFYNPVHGNCYVFNTGWNRTHTPFIAHKTGRVHGLSVTINIAQDEYTDSIGGPAGARVVVHNARSMPHPEEQGVLAMPGQLTSIGVVKVEVERLPDPYGDCIQPSDADAEKDVYADIFNVNYTRIGCFKTCYQKEVIAQCGCFDASIPGKGKPYGDSNVKVCQQENDEQEDCKFRISRQYIKGKLGCDAKCPSPCFDSYFKPTMSTAYWPSKVHLDKVVDSVASRIPNLIYYDSEKVYRENLLKVEVFYEEFNSEKTVEIPAYPLENFASDIGGVLGLWLGWSVLTVFEFFELAMDFLVLATAKLTRSKSKNSKDDWQESRSGSDDTLQMSFPKWNSTSRNSKSPKSTSKTFSNQRLAEVGDELSDNKPQLFPPIDTRLPSKQTYSKWLPPQSNGPPHVTPNSLVNV